MHPTAFENCKRFFAAYADAFPTERRVKVVEIGSQDINGSIRPLAPAAFEYVGVDFVDGNGVDVVLTDPYTLPFADQSIDIILSSSCFEHSEMFWILFTEIMRILKPRGLFYLNAPSNGIFHRHPVDCWRFYPDSGAALVSWAKRNGVNALLLESFISAPSDDGGFSDFVAVFLKDANHVSDFGHRILDVKTDFSNGRLHGVDDFLEYSIVNQHQNGRHPKRTWIERLQRFGKSR